ncbi:MAG TPA: hypothetical protein DEB10_15160 [Ruminococcaceae bacterium]|jgi:hypothetical protein|nr:hypothetical protein [Oscillospiraceae bacterium]
MRKFFRPAAVILTAVATILTTVLRVMLTPAMQDAETGNFHVSYIIIGFILASIAVLSILVLSGEGRLSHTNSMIRHDRLPMGVASVVAGSVLIISSLFDGWRWKVFGHTPPPNQAIISKLDSFTLTLTLIFGVLGGMFLVWLGFKLLGGSLNFSTGFSVAALAPVVWIWVRVVRYEVSYASAIAVEQSFYDFVMLLFTMVFLFSFARYISKTGKQSPRQLLICAFCTTILTVSGSLTSIILYMLGETEAYISSRLAGLPDLCLGIFAFCTAVCLVFARKILEPDQQEISVADTVSDEQESLGGDTVDDILNDIYGTDSNENI